MDCDGIDDEDVVDELKDGYCFGFAVGVVGEIAVAVVVGNYGLTATGAVIDDDINDDDYDILGIVVLFVEIIYLLISFYKIYIIIKIKLNTNHND